MVLFETCLDDVSMNLTHVMWSFAGPEKGWQGGGLRFDDNTGWHRD